MTGFSAPTSHRRDRDPADQPNPASGLRRYRRRCAERLGEAQTCYLIQHRPEFARSWWISDDREAVRYARRQGITTRETIDLTSIAVTNGDIGERAAFGLMQQMIEADCHLRMPKSAAEFRR
jgi:hypothetical protein